MQQTCKSLTVSYAQNLKNHPKKGKKPARDLLDRSISFRDASLKDIDLSRGSLVGFFLFQGVQFRQTFSSLLRGVFCQHVLAGCDLSNSGKTNSKLHRDPFTRLRGPLTFDMQMIPHVKLRPNPSLREYVRH